MLAIIQSGGSLKDVHARNIIDHLETLTMRQRNFYKDEANHLRNMMTVGRLRQNRGYYKARCATLESLMKGFFKHREALCDYLLFCSSIRTEPHLPWKWTPFDSIPEGNESCQSDRSMSLEDLCIPNDFICPISQELFEDPVKAVDGFTYERRSILRWYQIRKSSPSTGLEIDDTTLRQNGALHTNIKKWVEGEMLAESAPPASKKARSTRSGDTDIQFIGPDIQFLRRVPKHLSGADLHHYAFRGMKGKHARFSLHHNKQLIKPTEESIEQQGLDHGTAVHISIGTEPDLAPKPVTESTLDDIAPDREKLSLLKVYDRRSHTLFSYWLPSGTSISSESVIFRHWRHQAECGRGFHGYDIDLYKEKRSTGDGHSTGKGLKHWDRIDPSVAPRYGKGILSDEKLYYEADEKREETHLDISHRDLLVLKLLARTHREIQDGNKIKAKRSRVMSRLDTSKHLFETFINRTLAYNLASHIGLIRFSNTATVAQDVTHAIENFRSSVRQMQAGGDTSIWDALALANDRLSVYAQKYPEARKRIVCLSDGEDTSSKSWSWEVCNNLVRNGVVVDSFCIGEEDNLDLQTVSYLTGGYKFVPTTLNQASAICEMEPVLTQLDRPPGTAVMRGRPVTWESFLAASNDAAGDIVTQDVYPHRKQHPNLEDSFVSVSDVNRMSRQNQAAMEPGQRSNANVRPTRLLAELRNVSADTHPYYEVFVSESDIGFWKILMHGPPDSPYSTGCFMLYLHMEENYPAFPPKGRFCTSILHPNINRHGRICHSILDRKRPNVVSKGLANKRCRQLDGRYFECSAAEHHLFPPSYAGIQ